MTRKEMDRLCDACYCNVTEQYHRKLDEQLHTITHNEDLIKEFMMYQYEMRGFLNFYYKVSNKNGVVRNRKLRKEFHRYIGNF